jgi:hypothetical protein
MSTVSPTPAKPTVLTAIEDDAKVVISDALNLLNTVEVNAANLFKAAAGQIATVSDENGLSAESFATIAGEVLAYANTQFKLYVTPAQVMAVVLPEIQRVLLLVAGVVKSTTALGLLQNMLVGLVTTAVAAEYSTASTTAPTTTK